ncbi:GNAT family N-acetyltransferase [Plantactinospora solaniradicis]|uniref:GNAT family N-acetyltransferase n=1 Tax=Plantactinospora solaniradicis TaxID=1723736 RepID=A0ABW1K8R2_9ACTN
MLVRAALAMFEAGRSGDVEGTYLAWLDTRILGPDPATRILAETGVMLSDGSQFGPGGDGYTRLDRSCWNLYYRFAPQAWGKGYATELAREALAVAERLSPRLPVAARAREYNAASLKVARKAGLVERSELRRDDVIVLTNWW